ncbi:MAG: hypothetical protein ACHQEM_09520 [Chitinophagales bacterium]
MPKKIFAAFLSVFVLNISLSAQDKKIILLNNEKIADPLKNYHITVIKDDRADTNTIGSVRTGGISKKTQALNLENGVRRALSQFIRKNVQQDSSSTPIELHVSQFKVEDQGSSGMKAENELTIGLAFYYGHRKVFENAGGGTTRSTGDASKLFDELIRGSLDSLLHQFDEWWARNKSIYVSMETKPAILVEVTLDQDIDDPHAISYSPKRPLTFDDFQGNPDESSNAAAVTYSIVFLKWSSAQVMNNEIIVDVSVLANFNKTKSWCRKESRNLETLEHEQRHFDISAIKACELVDTIKKFVFSVDDFQRQLNSIQRQKQFELDQLQNQYDSETRHGVGSVVQERWNKMIREKLRNITCFQPASSSTDPPEGKPQSLNSFHLFLTQLVKS